VARTQLGGRPLAITAGGRLVAVTTVALDGTFHATAKRTNSSAKLRYQARVADEQSPALRATRLLIVDSQTATGGASGFAGISSAAASSRSPASWAARQPRRETPRPCERTGADASASSFPSRPPVS